MCARHVHEGVLQTSCMGCVAMSCVQGKVQGGLSSRPLLSVPHILADESSCYYHGYVLAEMSVHQTRDHFIEKLGGIVDKQQVSFAITCVLTTAALPCCRSCCCAVAVGNCATGYLCGPGPS